jgi:drug/metabolite transporter (DMT)-like permease
MNSTILTICAGAAFGVWALVMSLTGLRAGGVAFMLVAGTVAIVAPWYLLVRPEPFLAPGRDPWSAVLVGLAAACLNGIGMIFLPPLLDAPPAVVGTRMLILNVTVVSIVAVWTVSFGGQGLTTSKIAGLLLAVAAVWLLGR